jgi:hypothetical protein
MNNYLKPKSTFVALCILTLCMAGTAAITSADDAKTTRTPVSALQWTTLPNGRQVSPVWGDMKTGSHITFIKFTPGMKTAPHIHSNDYVGIVVKGTARHYEPGKPATETVLPAGSHWAIPAKVIHISECLPGSECIFAIRQNAAFDIKPAPAK